ncbi:MAG: T9SS type A sorting domain-containing protein, partial [Bacteroidales bacterium]|nr:T9SS type A sorting domain-containing protein [Bacteroidales bacterium]
GPGCQIMMGTTTSINDGQIIDFQNNYHFQIAPNPITDHFNIKYFLPESSQVLLRINNIQGQIISILINEYQQAGIHKIEWKLRNIRKSGLSPGVYVCSFIVNEEIKLNRKIVFQSSKK